MAKGITCIQQGKSKLIWIYIYIHGSKHFFFQTESKKKVQRIYFDRYSFQNKKVQTSNSLELGNVQVDHVSCVHTALASSQLLKQHRLDFFPDLVCSMFYRTNLSLVIRITATPIDNDWHDHYVGSCSLKNKPSHGDVLKFRVNQMT